MTESVFSVFYHIYFELCIKPVMSHFIHTSVLILTYFLDFCLFVLELYQWSSEFTNGSVLKELAW